MRAVRPVVLLTIAHGLFTAGAVMAQTSIQFRPSLTVTQSYDSNLLSTPSAPASDFVSRVTPGVNAQYVTPLWTLSASQSVDMERFSNHSNLDSLAARQHATGRWEYRTARRVWLAAAAEFSRTKDPSELNTITGLTFARASAQRIGAQASATRLFDDRTEGRIEYGITQDRLAGNIRVATETATLSAERRLRPRTSGSVGYRYRRYSFGSPSIVSHTLDLGWVHDLSSRVRLSLHGGPTLTSGSTSLDVNAGVIGRSRAIEYSISYVRTQTTALGLTGLVATDSVTASGAWRARRTLQVRLSPAVYRSTQGSLEAIVYRVGVSAVQSIAPAISLEAGIDSRLQDGLLYPALAGQSIRRHEAVCRLIVAPAQASR